MKLRLLIFIVSVLGFAEPLQAQLGGSRAFEYLNVPGNTRLMALGGTNLTSGKGDLSQALYNPALLNGSMDNHLVISRLGYFADISHLMVGYAGEFEKTGVWALQMGYFNYGDIQSFDEAGFLNGSFRVHEYVWSVGNSHQFGPFSVGANLKLAVSDLSSYTASALLFDMGGVFEHPEKQLTIGFLVRNLGVLLSDYIDENNSRLPLDVQLGVSFKPEHMPFRFSMTARNLNRDDVVYYDPSTNQLFGQNNEPGFSEQVLRRLVFGAELLLSPNFQLRLGYNHLLRQELKNQNAASGGAGFSFGFMFNTKRLEFAYSRALYHAAGGSNMLQMNINLNQLLKKKTND
ncbi:type IX secretion system protein PorQ [Roseivirga sp. UBA838]|uniref:type IX secretion system protein PorQ n=1 Tax=Roseivirga sp. UBA838 TaxID=1947393 RepID=UPI00257AF05A|nr:type IX secretion system protein PorQ [Roseivirga sp. UBA838]|tara:strand:- start:62138 stop:63175 length:1038 start_codon:yes stop_codon:yes gene_type:complete